MLDFSKILENNELVLRPILESDFEEMKTLTNHPEMWTYFTCNLSDKDELLDWIRSAVKAGERKERLAFTVIQKSDRRILGSTSLGNYSERDKRIEIGWTWLSINAQGTGINKRVKQLLISYCFEELNMERVESKTDVLNLAARKGLEKSGMTEEGILRSHTLLANGRRRDSIYYAILKDEWEALKLQPIL